MREQNFQQEMKESIDKLLDRSFYCKIPDAMNPGMPGTGYRFVPPKPFDLFFIFKGIFTAVELKMKKTAGGFCISQFNKKKQKETGGDLRTHQEKALLRIRRAGCPAIVLVNYRFEKKDGEKTNEAFVIDIRHFVEFKERFVVRNGPDVKSIPYKLMRLTFPTIERIKTPGGTFWDVDRMIEIISEESQNYKEEE